jgi:hypothetical protein
MTSHDGNGVGPWVASGQVDQAGSTYSDTSYSESFGRHLMGSTESGKSETDKGSGSPRGSDRVSARPIRGRLAATERAGRAELGSKGHSHRYLLPARRQIAH